MKMMRCGVLVLVCAAMLVAGCSKTTIEKITAEDPPSWRTSPGRWVEVWEKENPNIAERYIWQTAVSHGVPGPSDERVAERSARREAIAGLVDALGITVDRFQLGGDVWTDKTRQLIIGTYIQSLETQMANHRVNLELYEKYGTFVEDRTVPLEESWVLYAIYRLDKQRLSEQLASDTAQDFKKRVEEHKELTREAQQEAASRAEELTQEWMKGLTPGN